MIAQLVGMKASYARLTLGFILGSLGAVCVVGFQNCSAVSFATAAPVASVSGVPVDDPPPEATPPPEINEVIRSLQPSLAVRGIGCVHCHAQVTSTVITDFGFGSPYYFGAQGQWNNGSPYGDHGQNLSTLALNADQKFVIPKNAMVPAAVSNSVAGVSTINDYVKKAFASGSAGTRAASVQETDSIYIGAPTDQDLETSFALASGVRQKYVPAKGTSASALSGITDQGTYFSAVGNVTCNGDLVLRGPLYIKNLNLTTETGCRLYVIGSVFAYGAITYATDVATRNLQISSSRSISLGLGSAKKAGDFCDKTSASRWYTSQSDSSYSRASSLLTFFKDVWTVPNTKLRNGIDPQVYGQSIVDEAHAIEAGVGTLYDASCLPEGRSVAFERVLLNAPLVYSRYSGNVDGTIIAEVALMSIGSFKFSYDPVFNSVNVLPYIARGSILDVK